MILAVGIDAVDISRFSLWHKYTPERLQRIFSRQELAYCLVNPRKSAERFASRFAAKEAFFKAIAPLCSSPLSFIALCKRVSLVKHPEAQYPYFNVAWDMLSLKSPLGLDVRVSLTHTHTTAMAVVIIQDLK